MLASKQAPYARDGNGHLSPALRWDSRSGEPSEARGSAFWANSLQAAGGFCSALCQSHSVPIVPVNCSDRLPNAGISGRAAVAWFCGRWINPRPARSIGACRRCRRPPRVPGSGAGALPPPALRPLCASALLDAPALPAGTRAGGSGRFPRQRPDAALGLAACGRHRPRRGDTVTAPPAALALAGARQSRRET